MEFVRRIGLLALLLAALSATCRADDDDDDETPTFRGLTARISAAGQTIERTDETIAFDWNKSSADPRLTAAPFLANWSGLLLTRPTSKYQFHALLQGDVTISIDGTTVLSESRKSPGWVSGPVVPLDSGDRKLDIAFRSRSGPSTFKLFWSSESFALEPVPAHALVHAERRADLSLVEKGRRDFIAHRCNRCHNRPEEPLTPPAASLTKIAGSLDPKWIAHKLEKFTMFGVRDKMPRFGFNRDEAVSIAAFLTSVSEQPTLEELPKLKPADDVAQAKLGSSLFRSVGCVACHAVPRDPSTDQGEPRPVIRPDGSSFDRFERQPLPGGDLTQIGLKRSVRWISTWLGNPASLNASHQMPVFRLTPAERAQLALYLSGKLSPQVDISKPMFKLEPIDESLLNDADRIAAGKKLVIEARCTACHEIRGVEPTAPTRGSLAEFNPDWQKACANVQPDRAALRPGFSDIILNNVRVYLARSTGAQSPPSSDIHGLELLEQKNCLGCHDRGVSKGVSSFAADMTRDDESLRGQSVLLIPPSLTAVGDRLRDTALREAVTGELPKPRLPWLKVRMPRFKHSEEERDALVRYFRDQDRIPDSPPEAARRPPHAFPSDSKPVSAEELLLGQQLVGPAGFSCIACHEIGNYKPKNVAIGTRGSDLMAMAGRMRPEYFLRWTRSPARIVPGMEMPSYQRPVAAILDESIDRQLMAIWDAINDPRFTPPTNPTAVEQYFTIDAGAPARIVRDVFTNPPEFGPAYVPRSFAVGLNSGHNLLYDLDTFTLRQWTFGDFARQRTEGKSWYWDMAGVPIVRGASKHSDFALKVPNPKTMNGVDLVRPVLADCRLQEYDRSESGVRLKYRLAFATGRDSQTPVLIEITETLQPLTSGSGQATRTGFTRTLAAVGIPKEARLYLATHQSQTAFGGGTIRNLGGEERWSDTDPDEKLPAGILRRMANFYHFPHQKDPTLTLEYSAALAPRRITLPEKPKSTADTEPVITTPGYLGTRLPIDGAIMPTGIAWTKKGTLAFSSLKGHVFLAKDTNSDGLEDSLTLVEEGLAAPYGLIDDGDDLLVATKPEVLRLVDTDGDGRADQRQVFATAWGYTDNYHDWTCGFARDPKGNLFVGLGSDYAQPERPAAVSKWRGKVLKIDPQGTVTPVAGALRYPTGLAFDLHGRLFATDNQGVQNTFNELNHIQTGKNYGVPARHEEDPKAAETPPAVQIPHPWTRSVNGIAFLPTLAKDAEGKPLPADHPAVAYAGHGIGCEYDSRFLVRFTIQQVGDQVQGAVYPFSRPEQGPGGKNFTGPLSIAAAPNGDIYIGSIHDSGWLGGLNTGDITRLRPDGNLPNGLREMRATIDGFELEFLRPVEGDRLANPDHYQLTAYTRKWQGAYATPDSGRHKVKIFRVAPSADRRTVKIDLETIKEGLVYELDVSSISPTPLFPATAAYTLHRRPLE